MEIYVLDKDFRPLLVLSNEAPGACPYFEDLFTERLEDGFSFFEFKAPAEHDDAKKIEQGKYTAFRDQFGVLHAFKVVTIEKSRSSNGLPVIYVAGESLATELNEDIVRPITMVGVTATEALSTVLNGTRWMVGAVEWLGARTIILTDYPTVLGALQKIKTEFEAEIRFRVEILNGKAVGYVDLLKRRGTETGRRIEYEKDLVGIKKVEDLRTVATALIGLGYTDEFGNTVTFSGVEWKKSNGDPVDKPLGQDWVGDPEALQVFGNNGKHIFGIYQDAEEKDPGKLLEKTWKALKSRIEGRYTYEVEALFLEQVLGYEHTAVQVGDTVAVFDDELGISLTARVIEKTVSFSDPGQSKYVLGQYRPLFVQMKPALEALQWVIKTKEALWNSDKIYKSPYPPSSPFLDQLWLNTGVDPHILYRYDGQTWVKATPTEPEEVGAEKEIYKGTSPPVSPAVGGLWLDTSMTPNVLKRWNGSSWEKATPTAPNEVGAEKSIVKSNTAPSNPAVGDLWLDTTTTPNVLKRWSGSSWVKVTPTTSAEVGAEKSITKSTTAPSNPSTGDLWLDTSTTPNVLKRWSGSSWVKVTPTVPGEVGAEKSITKSTTAPTSPSTGDLWLDTSVVPNVLKRWDGSAWVKVTPTEPEEVGADVLVNEELQKLINGQYVGGTFIDGTSIISPVIGGNNGRFVGEVLVGAGNNLAGISGLGTDTTSVRFWAGGADKNTAPFRVTQDGTLYAEKGVFKGQLEGATGSFKGYIQSKELRIEDPSSADATILLKAVHPDFPGDKKYVKMLGYADYDENRYLILVGTDDQQNELPLNVHVLGNLWVDQVLDPYGGIYLPWLRQELTSNYSIASGSGWSYFDINTASPFQVYDITSDTILDISAGCRAQTGDNSVYSFCVAILDPNNTIIKRYTVTKLNSDQGGAISIKYKPPQAYSYLKLRLGVWRGTTTNVTVKGNSADECYTWLSCIKYLGRTIF